MAQYLAARKSTNLTNTFFKKCDITQIDYIKNGQWVGYGDDANCTDPKIFFNDATGKVEDLKIKFLRIRTFDNNHVFNSDSMISSLNWNISWDPINYGVPSKCFRLTIPENIAKEGINDINFLVKKAKKINILFFAVKGN